MATIGSSSAVQPAVPSKRGAAAATAAPTTNSTCGSPPSSAPASPTKRVSAVLNRRYLLPLTTGATHWVQLHFLNNEYYLACFERQEDTQCKFLPKLKDAHLVNNTTEKGPCLFLICPNGEFEFQADSKELFNAWLDIFVDCGIKVLTFDQLYRLQSFIGEGSFAKVYIGHHMFTGEEVVVKAIDKRKVKDSNVYTEIEVLRRVCHPYIIRLFAAYEKEDTICLVLEYLRGGELFDWLSENGPYTEVQAKQALRRVLQGLQCLHQRGIVHRDLKTENLILEEKGNPLSLKIIDFGLASTIGSSTMRMRCGSPGYVAPEILEDRPYGVKVDIFSAGIILFTILAGYPPFRGSNVKEILRRNLQCRVTFNHSRWVGVSNSAMDLILWMTNRDPDRRCSAIQALTHPWFEKIPSPITPGSTTAQSPIASKGQQPSVASPFRSSPSALKHTSTATSASSSSTATGNSRDTCSGHSSLGTSPTGNQSPDSAVLNRQRANTNSTAASQIAAKMSRGGAVTDVHQSSSSVGAAKQPSTEPQESSIRPQVVLMPGGALAAAPVTQTTKCVDLSSPQSANSSDTLGASSTAASLRPIPFSPQSTTGGIHTATTPMTPPSVTGGNNQMATSSSLTGVQSHTTDTAGTTSTTANADSLLQRVAAAATSATSTDKTNTTPQAAATPNSAKSPNVSPQGRFPVGSPNSAFDASPVQFERTRPRSKTGAAKKETSQLVQSLARPPPSPSRANGAAPTTSESARASSRRCARPGGAGTATAGGMGAGSSGINTSKVSRGHAPDTDGNNNMQSSAAVGASIGFPQSPPSAAAAAAAGSCVGVDPSAASSSVTTLLGSANAIAAATAVRRSLPDAVLRLLQLDDEYEDELIDDGMIGIAGKRLEAIKGWHRTKNAEELDEHLEELIASMPFLPSTEDLGSAVSSPRLAADGGAAAWKRRRALSGGDPAAQVNKENRLVVTSGYFRACRFGASRLSMMSFSSRTSSRALSRGLSFYTSQQLPPNASTACYGGLEEDLYQQQMPLRKNTTGISKTVRFAASRSAAVSCDAGNSTGNSTGVASDNHSASPPYRSNSTNGSPLTSSLPNHAAVPQSVPNSTSRRSCVPDVPNASSGGRTVNAVPNATTGNSRMATGTSSSAVSPSPVSSTSSAVSSSPVSSSYTNFGSSSTVTRTSSSGRQPRGAGGPRTGGSGITGSGTRTGTVGSGTRTVSGGGIVVSGARTGGSGGIGAGGIGTAVGTHTARSSSPSGRPSSTTAAASAPFQITSFFRRATRRRGSSTSSSAPLSGGESASAVCGAIQSRSASGSQPRRSDSAAGVLPAGGVCTSSTCTTGTSYSGSGSSGQVANFCSPCSSSERKDPSGFRVWKGRSGMFKR